MGTDRDSETRERNRIRETREDGQGERQRQRHTEIFLKTNKENKEWGVHVGTAGVGAGGDRQRCFWSGSW